MMKRALFSQMRNEWRDNIWLVIGLTIVGLAVWLMSLEIFSEAKGLFYPLGADVENVYVAQLAILDPDSPDYIDRGENKEAEDSQDFRILIANIRKSPYVEEAAFSNNAMPYSYSFYGGNIAIEMEPRDSIGYNGNYRRMSPEMVRVLKIHSRTGKSVEELENILRRGDILVSNIIKNNGYRTPEEMLNSKRVYNWERYYHVGDIVDVIRRDDYEISESGNVFIPIDESKNFFAESIAIRLKPGTAREFREEFENNPAMFRHGNMFLHSLSSLEDIGENIMKRKDNSFRMKSGLIISLIVIVALGLLGVFWFRVQQRIGEIAIRKVAGGTSGDIFRRMISEGLVMLLFATILMAVIGWPLAKIFILKSSGVTVMDVIVAEAITVAVMAIGIVISIAWPARRAMKIQPAIAIKDE